MIAGFPFIASSFDPDARAFVQATGATDRAAINYFVKGLRALGLWDDIVCWPLRSAQNAGTGSTAYSLGGLGTYNGTLVNGPTWGTDGIDTSPSNAYIEIPQNFLNGANSIVGQTGSMLAVFANFATDFGIISNRGASGNFWNFGTRNSTTQIYIGSNVTGATNQVITKAGLNTNNLQFASWRMNGSINRYTIRWNGTDSQSNIVSGGTASSRTNFQIGRENLSQFALKCAFCMTVEGLAISNEQHDALEILYKSTLGQGLGLP